VRWGKGGSWKAHVGGGGGWAEGGVRVVHGAGGVAGGSVRHSTGKQRRNTGQAVWSAKK